MGSLIGFVVGVIKLDPNPKISSTEAVVSFLTLLEPFFSLALETFSTFDVDSLFDCSFFDSFFFFDKIFLTSSKENPLLSFLEEGSLAILLEFLK